MKYCSFCSAELTMMVPDEDNRLRHVCLSCNTVHYLNPKVVVGCILEWQGAILLCKRAIEPRSGYWTLPAGFMENHESSLQGAAREASEEANAEAQNLQLFAVYNLPRISQLYIMYRGILGDGLASTGHETLETGLYFKDAIPWAELAFPIVTESLQRYFEDRENNHWRVHNADIFSPPGAAELDIKRYG
ncbi:MAG: NUDIX hydrolase [Gammaproteobacteria bacterium]|nr:NUDIX hydrolase [Gammaproteobacteria bacterium]